VRRREFITLIGGAAAWPMTARAQQRPMPVIGYLSAQSPNAVPSLLVAFRDGLNAAGYAEGRNVAIDYLWADFQYDRLPKFAADLVRRRVDVIVATGATNSPIAAKAATTTIPIVFLTGGDPVKLGLVSSFNRPNGNLTGVSWMSNTVFSKKLELLRELVPEATTIGFLVNPANPNTVADTAEVHAAAGALGLSVLVAKASSANEIDGTFAEFVQAGVKAVLLGGDPFFLSRRVQLAVLAARHGMPTSHDERSGVEAGGLMSYGASVADAYRQVGLYTGRVLKGEKPSNLAVQQAVKFELVLNLRTAKTLGLDMPAKLLALADAVID
jgi:putative tryptophan/tyrosine transport system substrate-binding protein